MTTPSLMRPERDEFATTDMSEAREFLDQVYNWRITVDRPNPPDSPLTVSSSTVGSISSGHADAPGDLSYQVTGADQVVIDTLFKGTFELEYGSHTDRYGPGDVFVANDPQADFCSKTHDIGVLTTIFPASLLAGVAGTDPDRTTAPVEFLSYAPLAGKAQQWRNVSRFVDGLLNEPDGAATPLTIGPAGRLLAATALATFPNTAINQEQPHDRTDATPTTLRHATTFIHAHAGADISLADIAAAAHVTPRALQYAFRRHLGTTPMAYLRRVRLDAAHQALQLADPTTGGTVTDIAAAWGFLHPGRFSQHYRRTYGQSPSTTLHA